MKPIEPGCLAITVNCAVPANNGRTVRVIRYLGNIPHVYPGFEWSGDRWEVDGEFALQRGGSTNTLPTFQLLRIDGYDPAEEQRETESKQDLSTSVY